MRHLLLEISLGICLGDQQWSQYLYKMYIDKFRENKKKLYMVFNIYWLGEGLWKGSWRDLNEERIIKDVCEGN